MGLSDRISAWEQIVRTMRAELAAVPDRALELARLQREVRLLSEVFVVTQQRLRQEELREALTFSNIRVIDPAQLQYRPIWPRKKLGLAVGMMLGLGFGLLAMVVVDSADGTVRSARELSTVAGAPVLVALTVNGRVTAPPAPEAAALLTVGAGAGAALPPLVIVAVDGNGGPTGAVDVGAALSAADGPSREVRLAPPVVSYAAAREALALGGPVQLAVIQGRTALRAVERAVRLLREAGGRRRRSRCRVPVGGGGDRALEVARDWRRGDPDPSVEERPAADAPSLPARVRAAGARGADLAGALLLLLAAWPLVVGGMAVVFAAGGRPLFFGHVRVGRGGKLFRCWKLRTMRSDAEERLSVDPDLRQRYVRKWLQAPLRGGPPADPEWPLAAAVLPG